MTRHDSFARPGALAPLPDHLSWSQVQQLSSAYRLSCPRQWAYGRLFNLPREAGFGMACGSMLDALVQDFWNRRRSGNTPAASLADCIGDLDLARESAGWPESAKTEIVDQYVAAVAAGLRAYVDAHVSVDPPWGLQNEHKFAIKAADGHPIELVGYSDFIWTDGVIDDLKWSGKPRWNAAGEWDMDYVNGKVDQLVVYYLSRAAAAIRGVKDGDPPVTPRVRLTVVYGGIRIKTAQCRTIEIALTRDDGQRVINSIREADDIVQSGRHAPRPGDACAFCSFTHTCRHDMERTCVTTESLAS